MILFTSGTTGRQKGVVLSHHNVVNGGYFVGCRLRYGPDDRICVPLPLHHVLGCVAATVAAITHGASIVLPSERFDAEHCLAALEAERCTVLYGVPTMFVAQMEHPEFKRYRLDCLRTGVVSGAAAAPTLIDAIATRMHMPQLTVGYGMTEMGPILFTAPDDSRDRRATTAGAVQPHVECRIVDPQTGHTIARGEVGELWARGYCTMLGYWRDEFATRLVVDHNGWLRTGDRAVMHDDGYVSIVGRIKDIIIRGGENVVPEEIEEVLQAHGAVLDAKVVAVPDREYGEEICAWVRFAPGASATPSELRQHCRGRLAAHKIPRYIAQIDEFPVTRSGKVQRTRLREDAARRFAPRTLWPGHHNSREPEGSFDNTSDADSGRRDEEEP